MYVLNKKTDIFLFLVHSVEKKLYKQCQPHLDSIYMFSRKTCGLIWISNFEESKQSSFPELFPYVKCFRPSLNLLEPLMRYLALLKSFSIWKLLVLKMIWHSLQNMKTDYKDSKCMKYFPARCNVGFASLLYCFRPQHPDPTALWLQA